MNIPALIFTLIAIAAAVWMAVGIACPRSRARYQMGEVGGWAMRLLGQEK